MITRIVLLKLSTEHATAEGREEVAGKSREVLPGMPGVLKADVGVGADTATLASWDVSLVLQFAAVEDLEPFRVDPAHREYVDLFLKPRLEDIQDLNFSGSAL
ncbi:MAG: Dabb family protein [bacterium]|nr:Dabb family protein [bacterium]